MPYSFTQIEKDKSSRIGFVFFFLIFFYFVVALSLYWSAKFYYFIEIERQGSSSHIFSLALSWYEIYSTLFIAFVVGFLHWIISIGGIVNKALTLLRAVPIDPKDRYHAVFKNILEEVSIASGGIALEGVVVPTPAMNAFALMDFQGRAVVGLTEGILSGLNRAQLEAVVAHEVAHIASGDCLETTITTSLFDLYKDLLSTLGEGAKHARKGDAALFFIFGFGVLQVTLFISQFFKMFISREREYRADAVAVRLCRDPLSLAEALYAISRRWRGSGISGDGMEAIFIVNPEYASIDENEGFVSDLFSTHPPVNKRISILLDLAHSNMQTLENKFKSVEPLKQPAPEQVSNETIGTSNIDLSGVNQIDGLWRAYRNGQWEGPFTPLQLMGLGWVSYDTYVNKAGTDKTCLFYQDNELKRYREPNNLSATVKCPRCQVSLGEDLYKGAPVLRCHHCFGVLMKEDETQKILIREDYFFSDSVRLAGDQLTKDQESLKIKSIDLKTANLYICPVCTGNQSRMLRSFFSLAYPIEVDRCNACHSLWFDKNELEILQYLVEKSKRKAHEKPI